jgi:hypothetical protein
MPDAHHERDVPARGNREVLRRCGAFDQVVQCLGVLGADLTDDEGRLIATVSLVSQLIKDLSTLS